MCTTKLRASSSPPSLADPPAHASTPASSTRRPRGSTGTRRDLEDRSTATTRPRRLVRGARTAPSAPAATSRSSRTSRATGRRGFAMFHEARDLVYNMVDCRKPIVAGDRRTGGRRRACVALLADVSIARRPRASSTGTPRLGVAAGDHAVLVWPLLCRNGRKRSTTCSCASRSAARRRSASARLALRSGRRARGARARRGAALASGRRRRSATRSSRSNNWLKPQGPHSTRRSRSSSST